MNRYLIATAAAFGVALAVGISAAPASAQATRTWVSGLGDDANPCSRTAPCKTFPGAYSRTAAGGEIDVIDPGGYGTISISKAITIDGGGSFGSILAAGTTGVVVNAGASDRVSLRRIAINGVSQYTPSPGVTGITFNTGLVLELDDVVIENFTQYGVNFTNSTTAYLDISRSFVTNCGTGAVNFAPTGSAIAFGNIQATRIIGSGFGVSATSSGSNQARVQVSGTSVDASGDGFLGDGSNTKLSINNSVSSNNTTGVHSRNSAVVSIADTMYATNTTGLLTESSGQIISFGNNRNAQNPTPGAPSSTPGQQ